MPAPTPDRPAVVILSGRHRPHELFLFGISVILGLSYLFGSPPPNSLAAELPAVVFKAWAVALLVSGGFGLFGCLAPARHREAGLQIERGALLINAGAVAIYTTVLFAFGGWRALGAGLIAAAWAAANIARAVQISNDLRAMGALQA